VVDVVVVQEAQVWRGVGSPALGLEDDLLVGGGPVFGRHCGCLFGEGKQDGDCEIGGEMGKRSRVWSGEGVGV
jgi:hypothetical protein